MLSFSRTSLFRPQSTQWSMITFADLEKNNIYKKLRNIRAQMYACYFKLSSKSS